MVSYSERLKRCPVNFRQMTGVTPAEFDHLMGQLKPRYQQAEDRRKNRPGRLRRPGGGPKFTLLLTDRLLMLLIYYRTYVSHVFLGFLFAVDDATVGRNINPLQRLLAGIFRLPERRISLTPEEIATVFFDAVEQPINRPQRGQWKYYSGKKKRHTLKHQVIVARCRKPPGPAPGGQRRVRRLRVLALSPAFGGRDHDKSIYDQTRAVIPRGVSVCADTAYLGTACQVPVRTPPGGELTPRQKRGNRRLAQQRVAVEHGIGKMKIWRIAAERYRNPRRGHTLMLKNIAGLHNRMFG